MKVYHFLGTKAGTLDQVQVLLIAGGLFAGILLHSITLLFLCPLGLFIGTHLIKRFWFDGRQEWAFMLGRILFNSTGSWNLNVRDRIRPVKGRGDRR